MKWLAVWATLLGLAACTELPTRAAVPPLPEEALTSPEHFVVVTVRNTPLANASRAGSTVRGYDTAGGYSASASARATVDAIARDRQNAGRTHLPAIEEPRRTKHGHVRLRASVPRQEQRRAGRCCTRQERAPAERYTRFVEDASRKRRVRAAAANVHTISSGSP